MDLTVPAAFYDLRIQLASEKVVDKNVREPPTGWTQKRVKRRRSYARRDKSIAWQIDVTEITTSSNSSARGAGAGAHTHVSYEIEVELRESVLLQVINEGDADKLGKLTTQLASQLWWIMSQINPISDALDVEETLRDHPNKKAVQLALATCGALKRFMDSGQAHYDSPIGNGKQPPSAALSNVNFIGCMPVNFSRHDMEEIQRSPDNAYFLSEKTDGVRHLLVFTGDTAVLIDRAMRGKQPVPAAGSGDGANDDPFAPVLGLIAPGTVLDGEVVMNRRGRKPRPIFIVFDVMAVNATTPVLHLPFEDRLRLLKQASFTLPTASRDVFDPSAVASPNVALPLVRKNFVKRTDVDELLSFVVEERGMRCYRNGDLHYHLTDGIIFQPNRPYVCGTDRSLLKWKFLDTVTIDVEMLPLRQSDEDDALRVGCMGEEQTSVDMTRHIILPKSERMRLEADKFESGGRIAEVGFDPETGEWYYRTMRSDKVAPNHISTVLGTLLELAESLTTEELRYRLSIPSGQRDTYRKDMRGMLKQLLDHQRKKLQASRASASHR
jgi:mRNA capping enzyme, catalytic domain/mRNA capping enzyme, beta chain/mRNA capping enzyme, C-terminal domain